MLRGPPPPLPCSRSDGLLSFCMLGHWETRGWLLWLVYAHPPAWTQLKSEVLWQSDTVMTIHLLQGDAGLHGVDIPRRLEPRRPGGRLAISTQCSQTQGAQLQCAASVMLRQIFCSPLTLAIA